MKDRVSKHPGRALITPEDGSAPFYATITRADEPTQPGDPLGKITFLRDETAAQFNLDETATPDGVFSILAQRNAQNFAIEKITSSRTWIAPKAAEQRFKVFAVGGGGGGGGNPDESASGGGGGSGYIEVGEFKIAEGTVITVLCGAGGALREDGGTTEFGDLLRAMGGKCGATGSDAHGGDGGAGGGGSLYGHGGNGSDYGGGGGGGRYGGNGGDGGTYGGGGGGGCIPSTNYVGDGGTGGAYGGNGGAGGGAGADGVPFAAFKFWQTLFNFDSLGTASLGGSGSSGGGGGGGAGYGGCGGRGTVYGGGGGGGFGGNGGNADTNGAGGGGGYGGTGGNGTFSCGGGGGGFFSNGGTGAVNYVGGGGGGFFANGNSFKGGAGGVLIMYIKED